MRSLHLAVLLAAAWLQAGEPTDLLKALDQRGAFDTVAALTRDIGPRLVGSPADAKAHAWAAARFEALGLKVTTETIPMSRTWVRGSAVARLQGRDLPVAQSAWTPATPGLLKAPVVLLQAGRVPKDLTSLKGTIVLAGAPAVSLDPPQMRAPLRLGPQPPEPRGLPLHRLLPELRRAGVRAVLMDAGKTGDHLNMDGDAEADPARTLPMAFVAHSAYVELAAAAARGERMELELGGSYGPAGRTFNTVAELPGRELPAEVVILGAHLDSWDLAPGAMDNGAGVAAVMEAARLLAAHPERPRRTVRFVLFGGEEVGFLGSQAHAERVRRERTPVSAVFVLDTGAGAVDGVALQGRAKVVPVLRPILEPLKPLGVVDTDLREETGTDHLPFHKAGIPAFCLEQKQHTYARDHHSAADTLDKVDPAEVQQCAVVLAWLGWSVADLAERLPR
jgi:carboxypeptidase Q